MHRLSKLEPAAYVALRIVAGASFAVHGAQKVLGVLAERPTPAVGSQLWIGGVIELVAGLLIALGLATRLAALLASGTMAVAYVQFHWRGELSDWRWIPTVNHGELAAIYAMLFLLVAARGPGPLALDARLRIR
jgi:putative oxidoreductase